MISNHFEYDFFAWVVYFTRVVGSHSGIKYESISTTSPRYHHPLFLRSRITFFTFLCFANSSIERRNSSVTFSQKFFISIRKFSLSRSEYSISFMTIFALVTSISWIFSPLLIVSVTVVPAGHLIQDTTSLREFCLVISFSFTFIIVSHHLSPALSDGDHFMGDTIRRSHGCSISI